MHLHICQAKPYTVITSRKREFRLLDGVRCVVEQPAIPLLTKFVSEHNSPSLAYLWKVGQNQISRLRSALGVPLERGGRRELKRAEASPKKLHIQTIGIEATGQRLIFVAAKPTESVLIPNSNVIVERCALHDLALYMAGSTAQEQGERLGLPGQTALYAVRKYCSPSKEPESILLDKGLNL